MRNLFILCAALIALTACSESERPAAQTKHALNSAQQAADRTAEQAAKMAEQAQKAAQQ